MKRLIFIIASILLGQTVCAQDIIQKKDATEIQAKVLKITDTEIEYQRWDNPDGPIYTIPAEDVFTITYQNGSKEVISHFDSSRRSAADKQQFGKLPRYQGEVAFAYGSAVSEGMQDLFPRIVFETVHGVRINPYLFAGVGLGINYFYKDIYFSNGWNIYELGNSGTVLPVFANVKAAGLWKIISTSLSPISGSRWATIMSFALFPAVWTLLLLLSLSIKQLGIN
jgi:hypothetical protein